MDKYLENIMNTGELYRCNDDAVFAEQLSLIDLQHRYNALLPSNLAARSELLTKIFGSVGQNAFVEQPLHANWGIHTFIGDNFYSNFNLTLVDDAEIHIGNDVLVAPNVIIATAGHPVLPAIRREAFQFSLPVNIKDGVWLGAGAIVLPGVTIGENSVIGAGSVVTGDIPANVVAVGNPCRVIREISARDKKFYFINRKIPQDILSKFTD